jgi:hypothetical protein
MTTSKTHKNRWASRGDLLDALGLAFSTTAELYFDPLNEYLNSLSYQSIYEEEVVFSSSGSKAPFSWQRANIANPEYGPNCMSSAMDHAVARAYILEPLIPSNIVLVLPHWLHTPTDRPKTPPRPTLTSSIFCNLTRTHFPHPKMKMKIIYNNTSKLHRLLSNGHYLLSQLGHLRAKIGPVLFDRVHLSTHLSLMRVCGHSLEP